MLANCNHLSSARLERASRDFKGHTQHVTQLKKDLDSVFKRIRALKVKVASQHPEAYAHGEYFLIILFLESWHEYSASKPGLQECTGIEHFARHHEIVP